MDGGGWGEEEEKLFSFKRNIKNMKRCFQFQASPEIVNIKFQREILGVNNYTFIEGSSLLKDALKRGGWMEISEKLYEAAYLEFKWINKKVAMSIRNLLFMNGGFQLNRNWLFSFNLPDHLFVVEKFSIFVGKLNTHPHVITLVCSPPS